MEYYIYILLKKNAIHRYNIANNSQDKSMYKYMNLEQKLLLCNVSINFNKMFLSENIILDYAKVNI
jgi:hypothetical protein